MQAVIYVRVSSGEQVTGTSLDSQETQCRRFCAERGFTVLEVFREEGESAKTADRTALLRALEYCRKNKGKVQAFVVAKVDRFARNTEDHFYVRKLLQERGITLHSVSEPIGNSPTEKFIETVLAAGAEFDNAIRRQRCTDGMIGRINQGIWPYRPPLGYICAHHRKHGEKKTRPDAVDPLVFPIIQRTLRDYSAGRIRTLAEAATQLDHLGLSAVRQRPVTAQLVDRILGKYLNYYGGVLVNPWTGARHAGRHEPMISEEESLRIRLIRAGRLKPWAKRKDRDNPAFPLRRMVRCGSCGRPFTGAFSKGGRYPYYFCFNRACPMKGKTVPRNELHSAFQTLLGSLAPAPRFWLVLQQSIAETWKERDGRVSIEEERHHAHLTQLTAKRARLFEMREDGSYSREQFQERLTSVDEEIALIRLEAAANPATSFNLEDAIAAAKRLCASMTAHWIEVPARLRGQFEHFVFPEGIAFDHVSGVRTPTLGPLFALSRTVRESRSPYVDRRGFASNSVIDDLQKILELQEKLDNPDPPLSELIP